MYSRELDGDVLRIGASGWTYAWTFVLYDKQTETMWYHLEGDDHMTGISGTLEHRTLPTYPSEKTTWREWKSAHPDSGYLDYP